MFAVLIRFRYESGFSEARVRQVAEAATVLDTLKQAMESDPESRRKSMIMAVGEVRREAINSTLGGAK